MASRMNPAALIRRPIAYFGAEWGRMAPRERRLVAALGGAVATIMVVVTVVMVMQSLGELADQNTASRDALAAIAKHRDEFLEAKSRMTAQEVRIGTDPPQLAADLEAAAQEVGIQIPETRPLPPQPAGKRYLEHTVDVSLRQVDLLKLSKFLNRLETGRRLIIVTKLQIRRRFDGDKLDVTLTAAAFERTKEDNKTKKRPTGAPVKEKA